MPNWKKLIVSGSDAALRSLNVTSEFTASGLIYPTTDGDLGDSLVTDGVGNLSFIRPSVLANVKNVSGVTLIKGTPVHAIGAVGNSSTVVAASASVAATMPATFILNETIADDAEGLALLSGFLNQFDTSDFLAGDTLYVGINGGYTNIRPTGSTNLIQNLGVATKIDATNGSGYIYGSGRSNDVPNLPEGKIWVGDGNTITSSVAHLDETNERLGINTNTPGASLDVIGDISGSTKLTIGSSHSNTSILSTIAGGVSNTIDDSCSFIGGGQGNTIADSANGQGWATIGGGQFNCTSCGGAAVVGGAQNDAFGCLSFIGGGFCNIVSKAKYGVIAGGCQNEITGSDTDGARSFIGGGAFNYISSNYSSIVGGIYNTASGAGGFIGGGCSNSISSLSNFSVIAGGENGTDTGLYNFIGGGKNNYVASTSGSIVGGFNNTISNPNSHIIGSNITTDKANYTFVNNLDVEGDAIIGDTLDVGGVVSVDSKINITQLTLTDAATVSWNLANGSNSKITLGGNRTLAISNVAVGDTGTILVQQGSGTTYTLTLPGGSLIIGGATYTTTTTSNGVDVLGFYYDGTNYFWSIPQTATTGAKGDKGEVGDTGAKGDKGEVGDTGAKGDKGEVGDTGAKGDKGEVGDTGAKGDKGEVGDTGAKGDKGEVGDTGAKGDKGEVGDTGPTGPQGPTGADGILPLTGTTTNGLITYDGDGTGTVETDTLSSGVLSITSKATIGSGHSNTGTLSSIAGGTLNTASAACSFIGGGISNSVASSYSFIGGGDTNCINGIISYNSIVGGRLNCINGSANGFHSIGGGYGNCIDIGNTSCNAATIAGGCNNDIIGGSCSTIGGGLENCISARVVTIAGGQRNSASADYATIGGGFSNYTTGHISTIAGGCSNYLTGGCSIIGGGQNNTLLDTGQSFLGGGLNNCLNSGNGRNVLVGGESNCITGLNALSFLGGGKFNCIGGTSGDCYQFIGGGLQNKTPSSYSSIVGGTLNTASGDYSFIGGGQSNIAEGVHSYAGGLQSCTAGAQGFAHGYQACATGGASAAFGAVQEAIGDNSFIAGGASNSACAQYSFVGGFNNETTTSAKASSVLGESNCVNAPWSFAVGSNNCILGGNVLAVAGGNIVGGKINKVQGTYSLGNLIMGNDNCIGDGSSNVGGAAAFGGGNCILADGTVAIGINNNNPVSGQPGYGCNTLLLGCANQAHFGENSIVGGQESDGYGTNSISFGLGATSATGGQQYAFGTGTTNPNNGTTANISNSMVIGSYNVWNITDCHLFAVGDGTADGSRSNALNVSSNGRTGLGCTSPQTRLDVNGTTRTTTLVETSARRYKKNITSLQDQLENIKKLKPVEFEWKETKKKDIGLIAEDVEKIYPQLVEHDDNGDVMGVKYSKITSLLIKAIQEQQEQIDQLKIEVEILKQNK